MNKPIICADDFHDFIPITTTEHPRMPEVTHQIRWCRKCGFLKIETFLNSNKLTDKTINYSPEG